MATKMKQPPEVSGVEARRIPLELIQESETNPRQHWGDLDKLAASIREQGLLQPILVRTGQVPATAETGIAGHGSIDAYELVAGARRYRACKLAGVADVLAIVRDMTDDQVLDAQVTENDQRSDVHPLDQAAGYRSMIDRGRTVAQVAERIGRSESYVHQRLQLASLVEPFVRWYLADKIGLAHAIQIARLPEADQVSLSSECIWNGVADGWNLAPTPKRLGEVIEQKYHRLLSAAPFKRDDEDLVPKVGSCTACPKRSGSAPALWEDLGSKDVCTDGKCYQSKVNAQVRKVRAEVEAKGGVQVSEHDYATKGKPGNLVLGREDYNVLKKAEAKNVPASRLRQAVITKGGNAGKKLLVELTPQAIAKLEGKPDPKEAKREKEAAAHKDAEARRRHEMHIKDRCNRAMFLAIAGKAAAEPHSAEVYSAAMMAWENSPIASDDDAAKAVAELFGWAWPFKGRAPFTEAMRWTPETFLRFMAVMEVGEALLGWGYGDKQVGKMAERYGVDVRAIQKQAKAEYLAEQKAAEQAKLAEAVAYKGTAAKTAAKRKPGKKRAAKPAAPESMANDRLDDELLDEEGED